MNDKVVIITGGSSGIGKAMAFAFGSEGAKIVISARHVGPLEAAGQELTLAGIDNLTVVADVSLEADNKHLIDTTVSKFGKIDILINNAGITMRSLFEDLDDFEVIKKVMDVNFYGTVYATKFALPYIKQSKGTIVGISSIAGYRGLPVRTGYSASKFAVNGFLEALRTELLKTDVHILTACPGFTASNIRFSALDGHGKETGETVRDEEKMMSPEEVAYEILKAVKKRKRQLILTSKGRWTVFLNKWLPGMTDRIVYKNLSKEKNSPLAN
jgi:dehydrogenase/reductase SDR family member 7B